MDEVELPFLPGDTGLGEAIETLRRTRANALVTKNGGQPFMLRAIDLTERWNALADEDQQNPAATRLGAVLPRTRQPELPEPVALAEAGAVVLATDAMRGMLHKMFSDSDTRHAVRAVLGGVAKVVTASEEFAHVLRGRYQMPPTILRCAGEPVHYWESSELDDPARCNKPHGAPILRD
ncbi:MAG TPA: hypothetical protein VIL69_02665 [Roseomonas sp.]|jgi:hypothetical protein